MIKALFFDYGGVIADDRAGGNLYEQLAKNLGIGEQEVWAAFSPLWPELSRGKITEAQLWTELEERFGKPISPSQRTVWNTWENMPRYQEMIDFVIELKHEGYRTGIISTTIESTVADLRAHGGYDLFDPVILSCEVGYAKPDPEIYQVAMDRLPGVRPEEVIFLDDRVMCLPPAQALGMRTVLVENPQQAIAATKELIAANE